MTHLGTQHAAPRGSSTLGFATEDLPTRSTQLQKHQLEIASSQQSVPRQQAMPAAAEMPCVSRQPQRSQLCISQM